MPAKQLNTWIVPFVLVSCVVGCGGQSSSNSPTDSETEAAVRAMVEQDSGGRMRVVTYQKTDGQPNEAFGIHGYTLYYAVEVEVIQPCFMDVPFVAHAPERFGGTNMNPGDRFKSTGKVGFERRESGWKRLSPNKAVVEGEIARAVLGSANGAAAPPRAGATGGEDSVMQPRIDRLTAIGQAMLRDQRRRANAKPSHIAELILNDGLDPELAFLPGTASTKPRYRKVAATDWRKTPEGHTAMHEALAYEADYVLVGEGMSVPATAIVAFERVPPATNEALLLFGDGRVEQIGVSDPKYQTLLKRFPTRY
jgi:hypothetical protein